MLQFTEVECLFDGLDTEGGTVQGQRQCRLSRDGAQVELTLPLRGRWWVAGGHFNLEPHSRSHLSAIRYAYDFVRIGDEGKSYRNDGLENSDYYSYGQPVLAAAAGRVITAVGDVDENMPSYSPRRNPEHYVNPVKIPMLGNHVILRHTENAYTIYAHLQPSLKVSVNQQVDAGQILGTIGNSGESTEPHLHFHLADGAHLESANGIPVLFKGWKEDAFGIMAAPVESGVILSREIIESVE
jgi:hypothetical protein